MNGVQLLLVTLGALAVSAVVYKKGSQPGIFVVVLAALVSFIPGMPHFELEPEVILGVVIPPLLYSATLNFSLQSFLKELYSIVGLGVGLVVFTTLVVGGLTLLIAPELGVAAAFVLAAVMSPPDTITTISHGREMGLPRRIVSILTGESLVNDAAALTLFAISVAAVTGGETFISNPVLLFGWETVTGIVLGIVLGIFVSLVRSAIGNATISSALNLLVPFTAYLAAEQIHASGIIAVVIAGFTVSIRTQINRPSKTPNKLYETRLQEAHMWPVVDLLLEMLVFAYMGLQLRFVLEDLATSGEPFWGTLFFGVVILLAVIATRFIWVYLAYGRAQLRIRMSEKRLEVAKQRGVPEELLDNVRLRSRGSPSLSWQECLLVSWTGMRGIITLAAAASVPMITAAGEPFPGRAMIQVTAFVVAIGTLLIQGATLPKLAHSLQIDTATEEAEHKAALVRARTIAANAGAGKSYDSDPFYFDWQRAHVMRAVGDRTIDLETAQMVVHEIDLRQAAVVATIESESYTPDATT